MGQSSKKKTKKGGVGRRNKGRSSSKDHNSIDDDYSELLAEEFTALCAIFQEDCEVVSKSPSRIHIKLRPYSKDAGYEDSDVSALLSVRLTGCSFMRLFVALLSILLWASSNAREGRVMIYNLVEAAQEFLSEIVSPERLHGSVSCQSADITSQLTCKDAAVSSGDTCSFGGPFVYGFVDLFSGSGESWHWSLGINDNGRVDSLVESHVSAGLKHEYDNQQKKIDQIVKPALNQAAKQESLRKAEMKLDALEEESEGESKSCRDLSRSYTDESIEDHVMFKNIFLGGNLSDSGDAQRETEPEPSELVSSGSLVHGHLPHTLEKDLILAHLLRLVCGPKGPLSDALPEITSELFDLGIVSKCVQDLATKPSTFDGTFDRVFQAHKVSSKLSQFWKASSELEGQNSSPPQNSRYLNDFEELQPLGQGGFGHVVLCKNKLDGRQYAMKKIRLKDKILPLNDRILREVATLSRLQHQHVVRYYQAWFETGITVSCDDSSCGSRTVVSSSFTYMDGSMSDHLGQENKLESTYLYIQMEYCPRTLRQMFESYSHLDKELAWHLFRQIVEGLAHIHGQGIIHRDLTPNNIFFDARNDIKIGDFGLAKFLKLEQLDQDVDSSEMIGVSVDGTGQVGTYFYTAPEIEQRWPKINEKADMYSLGVVFLELWHPFDTAMERHIVLSDFKQKGEVPPAWAAEFPEQASLLRRLMIPSPSDRPSAVELLQNAFPPRMEYEMLDNILRTIHASDDTGIYDKIVNAIFNEDTLNTKGHNTNLESSKVAGRDTSCILFTDLQTESRDHVVEIATEIFRRHCAKHLEIIPVRMLGECPHPNSRERNAVKLLTHGGDMVELCHELRLPLVKWIIANRRSFFKRYEIAYVYRRAIGHSPPNRYLQGDFDIIGGKTALTEAEIIKATMDIILHYFHPESCDTRLNHADLLDAIWAWAGIRPEHRQKVAELLSLLGSLRPQSSERKTKWVVIRRQLRQELNLAETAVNRLQTVGLRFCGVADQALPRLRGALPPDKATRKALEDLSDLFNYLRVWRLDQRVYIDALMPPTESYHRNLFFQIYLRKDDHPGSLMEGTLLAVGGRYDYLLHHSGDLEYKSNPPGAAGSSLALETILQHASSLDSRPYRYDVVTNVLVCSRGGGGLLIERMELLAELWEENIRAEFVPLSDPSLTEQYEYANEHDIKCLVIITDTGVSQKDSVKVRHLELKKEKEVERGNLVKFLLEAMSSQFRNPSIWN
ncbi:eIF-2-alpha kinase GCN2 isoform X2 [Lycium barbarum]|uniref:eIF-2-alpha kinase GCN2 isoform X2 n=2 Tax=Lycium barbarum TaxID=112863 RepID=UPI00293F0485|nr:eIF-2-alpha kinase GCN2 isoform X2 [Lycium barbarum]